MSEITNVLPERPEGLLGDISSERRTLLFYEKEITAFISALDSKIKKLESDLYIANRKLEELHWNDHWLGCPHDSPEDCPTFYDGCHCSVKTLEHNIERADKAEGVLENLDAFADEFIASMQWSDKATDWEKTLVIGNIRGFVNLIRTKL